MEQKKEKNETREECEESVNCFLEENLDIGTSDIRIVGEKKTGQERQIVAQFNSYKRKLGILRYCKKLQGNNILAFEDFIKETASLRKEK